MKIILIAFFSIFYFVSISQSTQNADTLHKAYKAEMKIVSNSFSAAFYPNRTAIYSLKEAAFLKKIDSLQRPFLNAANKYAKAFQTVDTNFIRNEKRDIAYFFDRIILDYPYFHENHTGNKVKLSTSTQTQLNRHLKDFNDPSILPSKDFQGYVHGFLRHQSTLEVKREVYKKSDNKRLDAYLSLITKYFTNQQCREYWQYYYLSDHLDNWGSKNIGPAIKTFLSTCKNNAYTKTIDSIYTESANSYKGHLIETYKTVDGLKLDLHIFLPDSLQNTKRPVILYFSGGSWTEGTPEWDFYNCANYARKGWVAVSVEYRVADRHETTPFEAVKDARSAIRWLRINARKYNIDTSRIVASGNSAGGHLVLSSALSNEVNEGSDNLNVSATPNLLLVNAGVYSLYADGSTDWISRALQDKSLVKKISPQHLLKPGLPPMLIIHGTKDNSVDYGSAKIFADEMKKLGNECEFHTLEGAPHYIWYDRRFSGKVAGFRQAFLKKHGYE